MVALSETTTIALPADEVWPLLSDPALVASCIPGAAVVAGSGRRAVARHGPREIRADRRGFPRRGELAFDHAARTCTIEGRGIDRRGASRALASGMVKATGEETTSSPSTAASRVTGPLETFANAGGVHVARALLAEFAANMAKLVAERRPAQRRAAPAATRAAVPATAAARAPPS